MSTNAKNLWAICAALGGVTALLFLSVAGFGWVDYDDIQYIRDNPNVAGGLSLAGIRWAFTAAHLNYWQPLTWISHMIDCQLFGLNPGPHHVVNLLFHVANTVLVFLLLQRATGFVGRSLCVAALFAVHPLHVEPVAWLAERKGLLSAFFSLLALLAYVRYAKTRLWRSYALVALSFLLACMAKPIAITLPALLIVMDLWPLKRLSPQSLSSAKQIVLEKIPLFAISGLVAIITVWASREVGGYVGGEIMPFGYRVWRVPVSYWEYVAKTFWPEGLNVLYPLPTQWHAVRVFKAAFVVLAFTALALLQLRRRPYLAAGWFWFVIGLLPGIGFVAAGSQQLIADRFAYLPILGIFVMVVWAVADLAVKKDQAAPLPLKLLAVAVVIVCAWLSSVQVRVWRNPAALWANVIRINERNPDNNADTFADIALGLLNQGQPLRASNYFAKALELFPNFPRAQGHYARALLTLSNYPGAIHYAQLALPSQPKEFLTQHVLGAAHLALGNVDAAFPHLSNSLSLYPEFFPEHGGVASALASKGRTNDAIALLEQGMEVDPRSGEPHFRLAAIMQMSGNFREAINAYQKGLAVQPRSAVALNNLAWLLATHASAEVRNGKEAVTLAERACEVTKWEQPVFVGTLAAAYAEAGDFEKAVATGQRARDLARTLGQFEIAARNEQLITHYRSRNPWREAQ